MNKKIWITGAALITTVTLAGCTAVAVTSSEDSEATEDSSSTNTVYSGELTVDAVTAENADYKTLNDDEWNMEEAQLIKFDGASATTEASGVSIENGKVLIEEAGVYRLSGSFSGQVEVAAPEDAVVVLILDNAEITNDSAAAIAVTSADGVGIYLEDDSENSVSDTDSYAEADEADSAIHSAASITISGTGSLSVEGNGNNGITSKDDLVMLSGTVDVTAVNNGLKGNDALVVEGGELSVTTSEGDALKSDQEDDETKGYVYLLGGELKLDGADEAVQAKTDIILDGAEVTAEAVDHAFDSEVTFLMNSGSLVVEASEEGIQSAAVAILGGKTEITSSDDAINGSSGSSTTSETSTTETSTEESGTESSTEETAPMGGAREGMTDEELESFEGTEGERPTRPIEGTGQTEENSSSTEVTTEDGAETEMAERGTPPEGFEPTEGEIPGGTEGTMGTMGGGAMGGGSMADGGQRVEISGGELIVHAEGDGIDSNGTLTITGGNVTVYGPGNSGNGAMDSNGGFTLTGGTVLYISSGGMEETPETGGQTTLYGTVELSSDQEYKIVSSSRETLTSFTATAAYGAVFFSSDQLDESETYTLEDSDGISQALTVNGTSSGMGGNR